MGCTAFNVLKRSRAFLCFLLFLSASRLCSAQFSLLTQHNDIARTGANLQETVLNTSNVNVTSFGKLGSLPVDGNVFAQPLYVPNLSVNGATHNVLFVATEHNSVFAFDADNLTAPPLWQNSSFGTPVPSADIVPSHHQTSVPTPT
jgi:hypothetical protein